MGDKDANSLGNSANQSEIMRTAQYVEHAASETAQSIQGQAIGSFQENIHSNLTGIRKDLLGIEQKVELLEENSAKAKDLLVLTGTIDSINSMLKGVSSQVAQAEANNKQQVKELQAQLTETDEGIRTLRHEFENEMQSLESRMRIVVEEYHGRGQQSMNSLRAEMSQGSEKHRMQIEHEFGVLKSDVDSRISRLAGELNKTMSDFVEAARDQRSEMDRKVNEVIIYLKSQRPVMAAEKSELQSRMRDQVREALLESAKSQQNSLNEFKKELDTNRRWVVATTIAAVASLAAVLALFMNNG